MTAIYLTGTRTPGEALLKFLPDFLEMLIGQGHDLITSNKRGVDNLIIQHCTAQNLPLHVCEFLTTQTPKKREVKSQVEEVTVRRIFSPTWQRFRYLADHTEKMIFLHAAKTRGKVQFTSTLQAFEKACAKRDIPHEQYIVQNQGRVWVPVTTLRTSPCVGVAHLYLFVRQIAGTDAQPYFMGHFRLETWRHFGEIIQPGNGRREVVIPSTNPLHANLHLLHYVLQELALTPPAKLVIHHCRKDLPTTCQSSEGELYQQVRADLRLYPQVAWQLEDKATLQQQIGLPIREQQELWVHERYITATKGLYQ